MPDSYLKNHRASKIMVGDTVTVFRTAETDENGWKDCWNRHMNDAVGLTGRVIQDMEDHGFLLRFPDHLYQSGLVYPYFVLRIVR